MQRTVRAAFIVVAQPGPQRSGALGRGWIADGIRPFAQQRLNEAFGFAVGLWSIGARPQRPRAEGRDDVLEAWTEIAGPVVRHHAFDPHAAPSKPARRAPKKPRRLRRGL